MAMVLGVVLLAIVAVIVVKALWSIVTLTIGEILRFVFVVLLPALLPLALLLGAIWLIAKAMQAPRPAHPDRNV